MPPETTQLPLRLGATAQPVPIGPGPSGADAIGTSATLHHSRTTDFRKKIVMRCSICLSHYAGPMGICADCLVIAYPHGATAWMAANVRTPMAALHGSRVAAPIPLG